MKNENRTEEEKTWEFIEIRNKVNKGSNKSCTLHTQHKRLSNITNIRTRASIFFSLVGYSGFTSLQIYFCMWLCACVCRFATWNWKHWLKYQKFFYSPKKETFSLFCFLLLLLFLYPLQYFNPSADTHTYINTVMRYKCSLLPPRFILILCENLFIIHF